MKTIIIGGVAGGASCAARLRRMDERAEILVVERGPHVSFANCGLPYFIGNIITEENDLLLANPLLFKERFNIDVRTRHEVLSIDREKKQICIRDIMKNQEYQESYDHLVLSPGAEPIRPPLPGIDLPGIFSVRTVPDSLRIREWINKRGAKKSVIVGGGFIGLEMAENLKALDLEVTLVEMQPQLMPPFDAEMTRALQQHVTQHGVKLMLGDSVSAFSSCKNSIHVQTKLGHSLEADIVILAIGVRPETTLARQANLEIGARGGIRVNDQMRTSDSSIFAVGDAVEVKDFITNEWTLLPLAGPANRQGRIVADVICGKPTRFRGIQGTAICKAFDMTIACTGLSEKNLKRIATIPYRVAYLHPNHHVNYYPGAKTISMKLIYRADDGRILGAQAFGQEDVARKIDVLSMAIQKGATVYDLEEGEFCYAPQFGGAKDAVNFAGMIAANDLRGDTPITPWNTTSNEGIILDVRSPEEFANGHIPNSLNIPLHQLRADGLQKLSKDRPLWVSCGVGQRAHYAIRFLRQKGFDARLLSGGYKTYQHLN